MKAALIAAILTLFLALPAAADLEKASVHNTDFAPHSQGGGSAGFCTYIYYNLCSGWLWIWSGWRHEDQVGVTFDLSGCQGGSCCVSFYWYWRYVQPGRGFTVTYNLYDVDPGTDCTVGSPLGTIAGHDPLERWNYFSGLGCTSSGATGIIVEWDSGTLPYLATEQNGPSANYPVICAGIIFEGRSFVYRRGVTTYCPPVNIEDGGGPVDILMLSFIDCLYSTKDASWGEIKNLFR